MLIPSAVAQYGQIVCFLDPFIIGLSLNKAEIEYALSCLDRIGIAMAQDWFAYASIEN